MVVTMYNAVAVDDVATAVDVVAADGVVVVVGAMGAVDVWVQQC